MKVFLKINKFIQDNILKWYYFVFIYLVISLMNFGFISLIIPAWGCYIIEILLTGFLLYFVGDKLGNTLETLCKLFNISEAIIGILLGFITSIPELMTFFESQKHYKKEDDDMLGVVEATNNLLTSNILNLFAIQTIGILITSIL